MELRLRDIRIHAHPLALLLPLLGMALGLQVEIPALLLSLMFHEAGHLIAARQAGVRISALIVMPFGCGLRLNNLYALSPGQMFTVAVGGPLMSLLLLLIDGALAHWGVLSPALALCLLRINMTLLLFNLLPALPLDGGRMLYALTAPKLGQEKASRLGALFGYAVALCLTACTAWLCVQTHKLNLTLPACAIFILKGIAEDRRALSDVMPVSLLNALKSSESPVPMRLCAVTEDYPALKALRHAAPDAAMLYAVYRGEVLTTLVDERALLALALSRPNASVGSATKNGFRIA